MLLHYCFLDQDNYKLYNLLLMAYSKINQFHLPGGLGVRVDSGDNIPSDSLWSVQLKTNCNNFDLTETNIRTDSEVCFDNISTNFSNDTQAIIKLTSESSLSNIKGMCSVKLDI